MVTFGLTYWVDGGDIPWGVEGGLGGQRSWRVMHGQGPERTLGELKDLRRESWPADQIRRDLKLSNLSSRAVARTKGSVGGELMENASVAGAFQKFVRGKKVKGTWALRSESPNFVL